MTNAELTTAELEARCTIKKNKPGTELAGPCPMAGCVADHDGFIFWPNEGNYFCRGCGVKGFATDAPGSNNGTGKKKIVAEYDYCNANGQVVYQAVRYEPKEFAQRRPNGKGGWHWNMQGVNRILYRLPAILTMDVEHWLFICEGEKSVNDVVSKLQLEATTNVAGAGNWKPTYNKTLEGRRVVILPDNDDKGLAHAAHVAHVLQGVAAEVKIINLLPDKPKGDVSDWITAGGTREELLRLVEESPESSATMVAEVPVGSASQTVTSPAVQLPTVVSAHYITALTDLGYTFRLNDCDDSIEVNGQYLADPLRATIRAQIRDIGFKGMDALEDALTANAYANRYHPIRDYLDALEWDKEPHIATLASFFTDTHDVFYIWLRHWLIGAVAKAYTGSQNPMLVLIGPQACGKSHFAKWLCSQLPDRFIESNIDPENKDHKLALISNWIWEVGELGNTMRKADREGLKFFITNETVTVRAPYGRHPMKKNALASFIGTINPEGAGFLSDTTGNRRFLSCGLTAIDWAYADQIDVNQVWAEAIAAYHADESPRLTPEETTQSQAINAEYEVDDPIEDMLQKYFILDPGNADLWTATVDILDVLESNGLRGTRRSNSMSLATTLTRLGCLKDRGYADSGKQMRGYRGIGRPTVA